MKKVLNKPIATDDLGNEVYLCQYSKQPVTADKAIFLGPLIPSVSGTYVCHTNGIDARKQSKKNFDEMDANCNTCKSLMRTHHEKRKDGQLAFDLVHRQVQATGMGGGAICEVPGQRRRAPEQLAGNRGCLLQDEYHRTFCLCRIGERGPAVRV